MHLKMSRKHWDLFISKLTLFLSFHTFKTNVNITGKAQQRNEKQLSASVHQTTVLADWWWKQMEWICVTMTRCCSPSNQRLSQWLFRQRFSFTHLCHCDQSKPSVQGKSGISFQVLNQHYIPIKYDIKGVMVWTGDLLNRSTTVLMVQLLLKMKTFWYVSIYVGYLKMKLWLHMSNWLVGCITWQWKTK